MSAEAALGSWSIEFAPLVALLGAFGFYLRGWLRLRRLVPARFPLWRLGCFTGGLACVFLAIASPLDVFAGFLLQAHMVQHLLLSMFGPPLLLLGAPFLPILRGLPRAVAVEVLGPFLSWPALRRAAAVLVHPVVAWSLFWGSTFLWHVPAWYDRALQEPIWHLAEHACFFWTGLLFWWPVVQPWPSRAWWPRWTKIPYLLLSHLANTLLAGFLTFYDSVLYPTYQTAPRIFGVTALEDQAGAGAIMWVPGSMMYLVPAAIIAARLLGSRKGVRPSEFRTGGGKAAPPVRSPTRVGAAGGPLDLTRAPVVRMLFDRRRGVPLLKTTMLVLAVLVIVDGLLGPRLSPMNLAGVLPWTHWRAFTVVALLLVGNLFCMACPLTLARDVARRFVPPRLTWPRWLRGKWLAFGLLVLFLWSYEVFDLWDRPRATAFLLIGFFAAAILVDVLFKGASFCRHVCPIGQFHFVNSLNSPFEVRVRNESVCTDCRTFDCIRGNEQQRGCELRLFQPRKSGNLDCTFCLDCVTACPHDNVGVLPAVPGADIRNEEARSSIGRFRDRPDLAAVILLLVFGGFFNAAGMVAPVFALEERLAASFGAAGAQVIFGTALAALLLLVPPAAAMLAASLSRGLGRLHIGVKGLASSMAPALVPLGFSMWVAHWVFHLVTGLWTPVPVFQRLLQQVGLGGSPDWSLQGAGFPELVVIEVLLLDLGLLWTLFLLWRKTEAWGATTQPTQPTFRQAFLAFLPWALLAFLLFLFGIWIVFQPMEMRGTLG